LHFLFDFYGIRVNFYLLDVFFLKKYGLVMDFITENDLRLKNIQFGALLLVFFK
jgi:hypothetical protein